MVPLRDRLRPLSYLESKWVPAIGFVGLRRLHPLVQGVTRNAQALGDVGHLMATLEHLANGFILEFWRTR